MRDTWSHVKAVFDNMPRVWRIATVDNQRQMAVLVREVETHARARLQESGSDCCPRTSPRQQGHFRVRVSISVVSCAYNWAVLCCCAGNVNHGLWWVQAGRGAEQGRCPSGYC